MGWKRVRCPVAKRDEMLLGSAKMPGPDRCVPCPLGGALSILLLSWGCADSAHDTDGKGKPAGTAPSRDAAVESKDAGQSSGGGGTANDAGGSSVGNPTNAGDAGNAGSAGSAGEAGDASLAECVKDVDCPTPSDCFVPDCIGGVCSGFALSRGSRCEGGYCNGFSACLPCVDDAPNAELDRGCTEATPMCVENAAEPVCVGCREDDDCNDGVRCTVDRCVDTACQNFPIPAGTPCTGGVCDGESNPDSCAPCLDDKQTGVDTGCSEALPLCDKTDTPTCVACESAADCDDDNECTRERCSRGACEYDPVRAGTPCSEGYCNGIEGGEFCVTRRCLADEDCDDAAECTSDVCNADHLCIYTTDQAQCEASDDVCTPNLCSVGTGCQVLDISEAWQLLANGDLELGNVDWVESSEQYSQVIYVYGYIPTLQPHSAPYVAWLGGGEGLLDESNSLSQTVQIPRGTVELELSFFYQVWTDDAPDSQNHMTVSLLALDAEREDMELATLDNQDATRVWTRFTTKIAPTSWAGAEALLDFSGVGIDGYSHFFVDSITLTAKVCD